LGSSRIQLASSSSTNSNATISKIDAACAAAGITPAGRDWLVRAIHPALNVRPKHGLPDGGARPTAVAEYIREVDVTSTSGNTWDCIIISANGDGPSALIGIRDSGPTAVWEFASYSTSLIATHSVMQHQPTVPTAGSTWAGRRIAAPALYDPYSASADGEEVILTPGFSTSSLPAAWRRAASSLTVYNTSPALTDGGTVTAGCFGALNTYDQSSATVYPFAAQTMDTTLIYQSTVVAGALPVLSFPMARGVFRIPVEQSTMLAMNPGCVVLPAREGVYVPTRMNNLAWVEPAPASSLQYVSKLAGSATPPMEDTVAGFFTPAADFIGAPPGMGNSKMCDQIFELKYGFPFNSGVTTAADVGTASLTQFVSLAYEAFKLDPVQGVVLPPAASFGLDDAQTTVILFTSLPAAASLHVKSVGVFESIPDPTSSYVPFVDLPPPDDRLVVAVYHTLISQLPQAAPSNTNSWGFILQAMLSVLRWAVPILLPHAVDAVGAFFRRDGKSTPVGQPVPPPTPIAEERHRHKGHGAILPPSYVGRRPERHDLPGVRATGIDYGPNRERQLSRANISHKLGHKGHRR